MRRRMLSLYVAVRNFVWMRLSFLPAIYWDIREFQLVVKNAAGIWFTIRHIISHFMTVVSFVCKIGLNWEHRVNTIWRNTPKQKRIIKLLFVHTATSDFVSPILQRSTSNMHMELPLIHARIARSRFNQSKPWSITRTRNILISVNLTNVMFVRKHSSLLLLCKITWNLSTMKKENTAAKVVAQSSNKRSIWENTTYVSMELINTEKSITKKKNRQNFLVNNVTQFFTTEKISILILDYNTKKKMKLKPLPVNNVLPTTFTRRVCLIMSN